MAFNKKSLANLKPNKPGVALNPKGRPLGALSFKASLKRLLAIEEEKINELTREKEILSQQDLLNIAQIKKAKEGDTQAYNAVIDRLEGKPKQAVDNNHSGNVGINLIFENDPNNDPIPD